MIALTLAQIETTYPDACTSGIDWLRQHWPAGRQTWTIPDALRTGCKLSHALWLAVRVSPQYLRAVREWALDCAEHALPVWEAHRPDDTRPRHAINTARAYLRGEASEDDLLAARDAANNAATTAAARVDAYYAARAAFHASRAVTYAAANAVAARAAALAPQAEDGGSDAS